MKERGENKLNRKWILLITALLLSMQLLPAQAAGEAAVKEMEAYLDFVDYGGATMLPEQIPAEDWKRFFVIDARDADQYAASHIPGAVNIEWRQVLARRAELPKEQAILIYCNTGSLSAQAGFALRVAGMDNVRILQGGFSEWKSKGGFDAYRRFVEAQQKTK
ncbi:MAG TPA: rhodanese-like domain-containing protein [Gallionellaceae bacterium]|nr:rhodanese-like domain-containing protein [Gallionellaceae bacterium]